MLNHHYFVHPRDNHHLTNSCAWLGIPNRKDRRRQKKIYQSVTEDEVLLALEQFFDRWNSKYPQMSRSWTTHWDNLNTLFNYPGDIRRAIYTTNTTTPLNSITRKAIKKRELFPTDESARKVIYLAIRDASKKWLMLIRNWRQALNRFMVMFEDLFTEYMQPRLLHRNIYRVETSIHVLTLSSLWG